MYTVHLDKNGNSIDVLYTFIQLEVNVYLPKLYRVSCKRLFIRIPVPTILICVLLVFPQNASKICLKVPSPPFRDSPRTIIHSRALHPHSRGTAIKSGQMASIASELCWNELKKIRNIEPIIVSVSFHTLFMLNWHRPWRNRLANHK